MAIFNGHIVTNDGRNLLGRALSGAGKIVFTKAAFGQGTYTGDLREIKELVDKRLDCVISDILNDRGTVNIKIQVTNKNLTESFRTEEFGIYAKIEGDATEILYCYAVAQEGDPIPNNSFGDTFMAEHTVYIAFSSDAEADIYIKEGAVFLTRDIADKSYVIIDLEAKGDLSSGRTSLEADKIYKADDGKWYKNIGGDRSWMSGNGVPDELLKLISWEQIYKDLDKPFGTNEGEILEGHRLAQALGLEFAGELNNNELKQAGKAYWDNVNKSIYKCLVNTTLNYADASYFEALSNNDLLLKLQNLDNKNEFKALKNFPLNTIKLNTIPQEFSLTLEEMKALEYVVVYDVDFNGSSQSKFIFGTLARAESGEYWIQTPSGEQINFHVSGSRLYMSTTSGSRTVCISSIFYR